MRRRDYPTALSLTDTERWTLEKWSRQRTGPAARVLRARIVLDCAAGLPMSEVRGRQRVSEATVRKWLRRFEAHGLDGLRDDHRSGRPRTLTDEVAVDVVTRTVHSCPPDGRTQWTTRAMAEAAGVSQTAVSRIWRDAGLTVGTVRTCRTLTSLEARLAMDDLIGAYADPSRAAFAFVSELRDVSGSHKRALELHTDRSSPASSFVAFLRQLDLDTPSGLPIRLLLWDPSAGRDHELFAWLSRHPRVDVWPIPAPAWWGRLLAPQPDPAEGHDHGRLDWHKASEDFATITRGGQVLAAISHLAPPV